MWPFLGQGRGWKGVSGEVALRGKWGVVLKGGLDGASTP